MYIRLSRATFDPAKFAEINAMLLHSQESLIPAIKALPGSLNYYAGIDQASGTMVNISTWETAEHAQAMASLAAMQALREPFIRMGIQFEPIITYEILWAI
ncbi:MAG: hypothetical protein HY326_10840 [Chloroflexi bacterium]|nr:hypothetical protein [Chloroflexota bacterium]